MRVAGTRNGPAGIRRGARPSGNWIESTPPAGGVALLRDPDTSEVRATLRDVARTTQASSEDTLVFVYYSGHADDERLHLKGEPLSFKELNATLRSLPATIKLAVLDACKSGAVTRKGGTRIDEFVVNVETPPGSNLVYTTRKAEEVAAIARTLPGVSHTYTTIGGDTGAVDEGQVYVSLVPKARRSQSQQQIEGELRRRLSAIGGVRLVVRSGQPCMKCSPEIVAGTPASARLAAIPDITAASTQPALMAVRVQSPASTRLSNPD